MEWFKLIKKYLSEPVAIAIMVFIFACIIVSQLPNYIVTVETFAGEKQTIYKTIERGDTTSQIMTVDMELSRLQKSKWELEDKIDTGHGSSKDMTRLKRVEKQIHNLEQQKIRLQTQAR